MAISAEVGATTRPGAVASPNHQKRLPWMAFGHDAQYNYQHELHITSKKVTAGEQNRGGGDGGEDCCEGRRAGVGSRDGININGAHARVPEAEQRCEATARWSGGKNGIKEGF